MKDSLGDRMKNAYENRCKYFLPRRVPVIVRVDGRAFHTFTKHFIHEFYDLTGGALADVEFDARAFSIPKEEVTNYFLWRIKDWNRNSLQMFARAYFNSKEFEGKKNDEIHEMLHSKGLNWVELSDSIKNGSLYCRRFFDTFEFTMFNSKTTYEMLSKILFPYIYLNDKHFG